MFIAPIHNKAIGVIRDKQLLDVRDVILQRRGVVQLAEKSAANEIVGGAVLLCVDFVCDCVPAQTG